MSKFHINKHGVPAPCHATKGNCPLGGLSEHYDSIEDAQRDIDEKSQKQFGILGLTDKQRPHRANKDKYEKLDRLIEHFGEEKVIEELSRSITQEELKLMTLDLIDEWDMSDYVEHDDSWEEQSKSIQRMIGTEEVLDSMTKWLPNDRLQKNLSYIEDNFGISANQDNKNSHEQSENNSDIDDTIKQHEEKFGEMISKTNDYVKDLINEVEEFLDESDEKYGKL